MIDQLPAINRKGVLVGWLSNWLLNRKFNALEEAAKRMEREIAESGSYHEYELSKIEQAISARPAARRRVSESLRFLWSEIEASCDLESEDYLARLTSLYNQAGEDRHEALRRGAQSDADPAWAAAAACETWLQARIEAEHGVLEDDALARVEQFVVRMLRQ